MVVNVDDVPSVWRDAANIPQPVLEELLSDAEVQCRAFAPGGQLDAPHHKRAVILQARELWASALRDGDVIGVDQYVVRARPLTGTVRALLRPKKAVPNVW